MKKNFGRLSAVAGVLALGSLSMTSVAGAVPTGDYASFVHCPTGNASVTTCVYSEVKSGTFQLGNASVPINKTIRFRGGFYADSTAPLGYRFVNPTSVPALEEVPLSVPGGLTGLVVPELIQDIPLLGPIFTAAVNSVNGVNATAKLVGPVQFRYLNFITGNGPTMVLPVRIKLDNPFLGNSCYIGSASNPVELRLTTGTTAPPLPNTPVTGSRGTITAYNGGQLITATGYSLKDNAFAVPSAEDCGPTGFKWAVTPIVNLKEGFPSAAGTNSAVMGGDHKQAAKAAVIASDS